MSNQQLENMFAMKEYDLNQQSKKLDDLYSKFYNPNLQMRKKFAHQQKQNAENLKTFSNTVLEMD